MPSHVDASHDVSPITTLRGKRVLVTRARAQADARDPPPGTRGHTHCFFCDPHCPPADNYVALDAALRQLATFDWVVFTSVNGVIHVWERLAVLGLEAGAFASVRLAAIGPATTAALTTRGLQAAVVPEHSVAEALLEAIPHPVGQRFLLPLADLARDTLRVGLQAAGAEVVECQPIVRS